MQKIKQLIKISLMLFLFSLSNVVFAQTDDSLSIDDMFEMNLEELLNIDVVSSSKSAEKVNVAPNVITVFGADYIKSFGWNSLNDMLYKHAGFFPSQDYDRRTVGYRGNFEGWNNNHLLLMVDGVPFNDNLYGTAYTWEITPLIFTKSLEVIRGPGAAL
ncbi:MAG: Plug domain-containing protein [Bacteroidales bacterium]|nr:Plug domain-containing protein [Bacteroidales bacterium]MBN2757536.1 Plug domain-containing protein [Bacteroidales bacterium]